MADESEFECRQGPFCDRFACVCFPEPPSSPMDDEKLEEVWAPIRRIALAKKAAREKASTPADKADDEDVLLYSRVAVCTCSRDWSKAQSGESAAKRPKLATAQPSAPVEAELVEAIAQSAPMEVETVEPVVQQSSQHEEEAPEWEWVEGYWARIGETWNWVEGHLRHKGQQLWRESEDGN